MNNDCMHWCSANSRGCSSSVHTEPWGSLLTDLYYLPQLTEWRKICFWNWYMKLRFPDTATNQIYKEFGPFRMVLTYTRQDVGRAKIVTFYSENEVCSLVLPAHGQFGFGLSTTLARLIPSLWHNLYSKDLINLVVVFQECFQKSRRYLCW